MNKEVLEVVLKKLEKESRIASIIDLQSVPALPKGENTTSTILRVTLKVILGNGRQAKKSFIMKQMITEGIYSVIHKEMTYLMEEFEDTEETLWCKFIHFDPHSSSILLEDLKVCGYSLVPRQKGLDLDHAILALRGLGKYHGMAKVLEERGIISKDEYKPWFWLNDLKPVKCILYGGISNLAKPTVRRSNYEFLLKTYHDSLVRTLDKFGFTGTKPTLEEITDTMKRVELFGLTFFAALHPSIICSSTEAFDIELVLTSEGEKGFNEDILREPGMIEELGPDITDLVERHFSALD
ncbi:unnamed protein product [Nezara viridula]|uniref:CHK kinase-like domain-containing protein n=1 Tax=Nezara viridula TaxID=85310 RepID=A0A9P0HPW5_NEZVI|nr:unnamed protein product [Nezara viridula]